MLYSFSQASYDQQVLQRYFDTATFDDALLFWQDGVWALLKFAPHLIGSRAKLYVLQQDLTARNLTLQQFSAHFTIYPLTLPEWVALTEQNFPQLAC